MKKIKVALALPWYSGPDRDSAPDFLNFWFYLGRLRERLAIGWDSSADPLDPVNTTGKSEIPGWLRGTQIEFGMTEEVGCSLPGMARERCCDNAVAWGADYVFMFDADMRFGTDLFLRLLDACHNKKADLCGALAFTGRDPITPVIYSFKKEQKADGVHIDVQPVWDYQRDTLQPADAVGFGAVMIRADVFQELKKPWFNVAGMGEDIFFCLQMHRAGLRVMVDTAAKTLHKRTFAEYQDEVRFLKEHARDVVHQPCTDDRCKICRDAA